MLASDNSLIPVHNVTYFRRQIIAVRGSAMNFPITPFLVQFTGKSVVYKTRARRRVWI
jgi:hypothetical protein